MRYCSIDLEVTSLDPNLGQIIEFAAVMDDLSIQAPIETLPKFQTYIVHDYYFGEPYALSMHSEILKKLANYEENKITACYEESLFQNFYNFLINYGGYSPKEELKLNIAVANTKFLEKLPGYNTLIKINHQIINPAILYFNPKTDKTLPDTQTCMERAGISSTVAHMALEDAIVVVKLLRKVYPKD